MSAKPCDMMLPATCRVEMSTSISEHNSVFALVISRWTKSDFGNLPQASCDTQASKDGRACLQTKEGGWAVAIVMFACS